MVDTILNKIESKFKSFNSVKINKIIQLQQSGSYRQYFRIITEKETLLGVYNPDFNENNAYLTFSEHFLSKGINVPQIYAKFPEENIYFIEDLGDLTLFDYLKELSDRDEIVKIYKKVLDNLYYIQIQGIKELDLSKAYPRAVFDKQSILWDLNYFKYMVLKIAKVPFNEQNLEYDFNTLADFLISAKNDSFLYRDFQSKNIMLCDNEVFFIDFQGGRQGAVYYDLASLLYDSKANFDNSLKNELVDYYYVISKDYHKQSKTEFLTYYFNYVLVRVLQAFGAYGFRGLVERKLHFIKSIPLAIENIKQLLKNDYLLDNTPELTKALNWLVYESELTTRYNPVNDVKIRINSFSFKKSGYPDDLAGNGGGFVFDCRFLPNPGRFDEYKSLTGLDQEVISYLNGFPEAEAFISECADIIVNAVKSYESLKYTDLQVNFGCTGGQHRSVYCASKTAELLRDFYGYNVIIEHVQLKKNALK